MKGIVKLGRLRHPNLTLFMGFSIEKPYYCIVSDFFETGKNGKINGKYILENKLLIGYSIHPYIFYLFFYLISVIM